MALQKSKTLENGASGNYWKVTKISLDKQRMTLICAIDLFLDASHSDKPSLGALKSFTFPVTSEESKSDLLSLAYAKIKVLADSDLASATDC